MAKRRGGGAAKKDGEAAPTTPTSTSSEVQVDAPAAPAPAAAPVASRVTMKTKRKGEKESSAAAAPAPVATAAPAAPTTPAAPAHAPVPSAVAAPTADAQPSQKKKRKAAQTTASTPSSADVAATAVTAEAPATQPSEHRAKKAKTQVVAPPESASASSAPASSAAVDATHPVLKNYHALPVRLEDDIESVRVRYLFFKPIESTTDADDATTTTTSLLVLNVPFTYTNDDLKSTFSCFGAVSSAEIHEASRTAADIDDKFTASPLNRSAHVTYKSASSVTRALATDLTLIPQPYLRGGVATGMQKWLAAYRAQRPDTNALASQVDRFMQAFDKRAEEKAAAERRGSYVDEDGFTLVTSRRHGKRSRLEIEELNERVAKRVAQKEQKKQGQLQFYRAQEREKRREQLEELRKRFEMDKEKIARMRAQRKFESL